MRALVNIVCCILLIVPITALCFSIHYMDEENKILGINGYHNEVGSFSQAAFDANKAHFQTAANIFIFPMMILVPILLVNNPKFLAVVCGILLGIIAIGAAHSIWEAIKEKSP